MRTPVPRWVGWQPTRLFLHQDLKAEVRSEGWCTVGLHCNWFAAVFNKGG